MSECFSDFFVCNGFVKPASEFSLPDYKNVCVYEVLRVIDGVALFAEMHTERYGNSLNINKLKNNDLLNAFSSDIKLLLESNLATNGNVRYACYIGKNCIDRFAYYIPHSYPDEQMYNCGVCLQSAVVLRPNPNSKVVHMSVKEIVNKILENKHIYDVALTDDLGFISEGSRSNLFFIKGNEIFTAPDSKVLLGITRQKVLEVIVRMGYKIHYEQVNVNELGNFDAAFLTGTSPKALGINKLNEIAFDVNNQILKEIYLAYNQEINSYINFRK